MRVVREISYECRDCGNERTLSMGVILGACPECGGTFVRNGEVDS